MTRAHEFAKLYGREADAARGAEDEQGFAWLELGAVLERVVGGAVDEGEKPAAVAKAMEAGILMSFVASVTTSSA